MKFHFFLFHLSVLRFAAKNNRIEMIYLLLKHPKIEIKEKTFSNCTKLTHIDLPPTVKSIDNNLFDGCSGLVSVTIPPSVESIGSYAFRCCTS